MRKKIATILTLLALISGGITAAIAFNYYTSTMRVTFDAPDVATLTIEQKINGSLVQTGTFTPAESVRLVKEVETTISYTAKDGYADGNIVIDIPQKTIILKPEYSDEKNAELITAARSSVISQLKSQSMRISAYDINEGYIKNRGEWYYTTFSYRSSYSANSDTLRLIAHNVDGGWIIATQPEIYINSVAYPDIPVDIIRWADEES